MIENLCSGLILVAILLEFGQGAPSRIHFSRSAIPCLPSFFFGGICRSALVYLMASINRLSFGLPSLIDAPESPPLRIVSREESRRFPLCFFSLWHSKQLFEKRGLILFSKNWMLSGLKNVGSS